MTQPPARTRQQRARKQALDIIFEAQQRDLAPTDVLARVATELEYAPRELTVAIVEGVAQNVSVLRRRVEEQLSGRWTWSRMPALDRTLALIGAWEICFSQTPDAVAISEVRLLAEEHSTDQSAGFLVAILTALSASMSA